MNKLPGLKYTEITGATGRLLAKADHLNKITRENSAFAGFADLVNTKGGYRPSLCMDEAVLVELADAYDEHMEWIGDDRRAFRYGHGITARTRAEL